jgi:hypothetical protein
MYYIVESLLKCAQKSLGDWMNELNGWYGLMMNESLDKSIDDWMNGWMDG